MCLGADCCYSISKVRIGKSLWERMTCSYVPSSSGSCTPLPVAPSPHHKPLCNYLWKCFSMEHYETKAPM